MVWNIQLHPLKKFMLITRTRIHQEDTRCLCLSKNAGTIVLFSSMCLTGSQCFIEGVQCMLTFPLFIWKWQEKKREIYWNIEVILPCLVHSYRVNLYELIKKNNFQGFSLALIRRFAHALLRCLQMLHGEKIIHCDLKPVWTIIFINANRKSLLLENKLPIPLYWFTVSCLKC